MNPVAALILVYKIINKLNIGGNHSFWVMEATSSSHYYVVYAHKSTTVELLLWRSEYFQKNPKMNFTDR